MAHRRRKKPDGSATGWDDVTKWLYEGCQRLAVRISTLEKEITAHANATEKTRDLAADALADLKERNEACAQEITSLRSDLRDISHSIRQVASKNASRYDEIIEWVELKLEARDDVK